MEFIFIINLFMHINVDIILLNLVRLKSFGLLEIWNCNFFENTCGTSFIVEKKERKE